MLQLKTSVKLTGLQPQMVLAALIADSLYERSSLLLRITSANDSTHKPGSKHYDGLALDLGTKLEDGSQYTNILKVNLASELRLALGPEYDVVVEANHLHIEFDPKA